MASEASTAFYKGVKFWLVLLLAALIAALLWNAWRMPAEDGEGEPPARSGSARPDPPQPDAPEPDAPQADAQQDSYMR